MSDLAEMGIRKMYFKEYIIFYWIDYIKGVVYVIRILHMLIDSRTWLYKTLNIAI